MCSDNSERRSASRQIICRERFAPRTCFEVSLLLDVEHWKVVRIVEVLLVVSILYLTARWRAFQPWFWSACTSMPCSNRMRALSAWPFLNTICSSWVNNTADLMFLHLLSWNFWKCNFYMNPNVRLLVGWMVGRLVHLLFRRKVCLFS